MVFLYVEFPSPVTDGGEHILELIHHGDQVLHGRSDFQLPPRALRGEL